MSRSLLPIPSAALLAIGLVAACGAPAMATNFAILLGGNGCDSNTCDDDGKLRIANPLFQESAGEKHNPLYEPSMIVVTPPELSGGRDVLLNLNFGDSISRPFPSAPGAPFVFEITLEDATTNEPIIQFDKPITLGFELPRYRGEPGDLTLGFLDESVDPPVWRAEDQGLSSCGGGEVCGKTDHFTLFSIGVVPEPSALLLGVAAVLCRVGATRRRPA